MAQPGEKNISAFIDPKVSEAFKDQCEARGITKRKAVEGALRAWITMTPTEQNLWIENKTKPVFSADPQENEIYSLIDQGARIFAEIDTKIRRSEAASEKNKKNRRSRG